MIKFFKHFEQKNASTIRHWCFNPSIMNEELNMFTLAAPNSFRYSWSDIWVLWQRKWCTL